MPLPSSLFAPAVRAVKHAIPDRTKSRIKISRARMCRCLGSERFSFPALNRLDRQMVPLLPDTGTFLEIGANDGFSQSNTYYLEACRGWHGILIEPIPRLFEFCRKVRPNSECFNVACVESADTTTATLDDSNLMSFVLGAQPNADESRRPRSGRHVTVPATTISAVIDRSSLTSVDFMSVDVEGAEIAVLGGLDLARHRPGFLLVETRYPERLDDLLDGQMRRIEQLSYHDYLWVSI